MMIFKHSENEKSQVFKLGIHLSHILSLNEQHYFNLQFEITSLRFLS